MSRVSLVRSENAGRGRDQENVVKSKGFLSDTQHSDGLRLAGLS